jgi:hypothetical protein
MKFFRYAAILTLAVASTACFGLDNLFNFNSPSDSDTPTTGPRSYLGTWAGPGLGGNSTQTCGGLQWVITSQTGNQITGDFTGTCSGGITLTGTIVATTTDASTIPWAASGNATQGSNSCSFNVAGTGKFQGTSNIVVNYSGTACGMSVSGSDTIKRS